MACGCLAMTIRGVNMGDEDQQAAGAGPTVRHHLAVLSRLFLAVVLFGISAPAQSASDAAARYLDSVPDYPELAAAASGRMAWIEYRGGVRQLVAAMPGAAPRPVGMPLPDGILVEDLSLADDGRWLAARIGPPRGRNGLVEVRGAGPAPNERIELFDLERGTSTVLRTGTKLAEPRLAPDGKHIALVEDGRLLVLARASGRAVADVFVNGAVTGIAWSPDGRRIAFVDQHSAASFVGIYELDGATTNWLDPEISQDKYPSWSPDGRYLAFVRVREPASIHRFEPRREATPWSVMLADAQTGRTRPVWTADAGMGSSLHDAGAPIAWNGNAEIAFVWERTGFQQLYALDIATDRWRQLSEGTGEVWQPVGATDGSGVYFRANREQPEMFDLWFRDNRTRSLVKLTGGDVGWEERGAVAARGCLLVAAGTIELPRRPTLACGSEGRAIPLVPPAAGYPMAALGRPRAVEIVADDGLRTRGLLFEPPGGGNRAGLVYAHGGSRTIVETGISRWYWIHAAVASGYHVLAINYRSNIGFGLDFREAPGYGGGGGTDVADVIAAGRYLSRLPGIDPSRIGVYGGSYGGYLTTAAMARAPDLWGAGVSNVGVVDWQKEQEYDSGGPLPYRISRRLVLEDVAHASSASAALDAWRAPLRLSVGASDPYGWLEQAVDLGQQLRRRGVIVEAVVEPGGTHGGQSLIHDRARILGGIAFFDRHLRSGLTSAPRSQR